MSPVCRWYWIFTHHA